MSLLNTITNEKKDKPPIIVLYGLEGIGKTTIGAVSNKPIFVLTEDGKGSLDFPHFPLCEKMSDAFMQLEALCKEDHEYKTLCLDSVDWLERLIWNEVAKIAGKRTIEEIGYGAGYKMALQYWNDYLQYLTYLRDVKGMTILQTAHSSIKKFKDPESDTYDVYNLKLHEMAASLIKEHADCVFFMKYQTFAIKTDTGFNQKRTRATGGDSRVLYAQNHASAQAKNRYGIPSEIEANDPNDFWKMMEYYVPALKTETTTKGE